MTKTEAAMIDGLINTLMGRIDAATGEDGQTRIYEQHLLLPLMAIQQIVQEASETAEEREERELVAEQESVYFGGLGI